MVVLPSRPTVFFDVDNTLLFAINELPKKFCIPKDDVVDLHGRKFVKHNTHIETLKDFYARGTQIVIWSANGGEWASIATRLLGLETYVSLCIGKPTWYFDDKTANEFLPENIRTYKNL